MDSAKSSHLEETTLTDTQLWQKITQGHTDSLGILYDRHARLVYGIALKVLSNAQEAEDLTQDIFVRLSRLSYDPQRGSLRTFLAIVTRSRAIDRLRTRQRELKKTKQFFRENAGSMVTLPPEDGFLPEQSQEIHAALAQLSQDQQQLLRMSYYDGLTQATISERLDLPLGTVKSRVRRGLLKLRQILQKQLD